MPTHILFAYFLHTAKYRKIPQRATKYLCVPQKMDKKEELPICIVKFNINPSFKNGYEIRNIFQPNRKLLIRFIAEHPDCLLQLVENFKKTIIIKEKYKINFIFTATPKSIQKNAVLQSKIKKLFQEMDSFDILVEKLHNHCSTYGNVPNLIAKDEKNIKKIVNFTKSVTGNPHLDDTTALLVVKKCLDLEKK